MEKKILFVDDEKPILNTLFRSFRNTDFTVFTAESGSEALKILAREQIDVIISDMRMPHMSGHQLLRKVRDLYPATIRLILSGYAEEKEITTALMDGSAKMYLLKPWDNKQLHDSIMQLLRTQERLREKNLLDIINQMDAVRTLPHIVSKLMELINDDADVQEITVVLEQDPFLAAKVLRMANSAFYGIRTGSVSQAVVYLGLSTMKNIVLIIGLCEMVPERGFGCFNRDEVWKRANLMNVLVTRLYKKLLGKDIPGNASAVGLLYGIGVMALVNHTPEKYRQIIAARQASPEKTLAQFEQQLIGVTHQEVGGYLLDWWGLPQPIVECAMYYHDPLNASITNPLLVAIVHLANFYTSGTCPGLDGPLNEEVFKLLNISKEECGLLLEETLAEAEQE